MLYVVKNIAGLRAGIKQPSSQMGVSVCPIVQMETNTIDSPPPSQLSIGIKFGLE
jgi:hypothetical protein